MAKLVVKKIKRSTQNLEMETPVVETKKGGKKEKTKSTLPPDTYKEEIEPTELSINENNKLIFSVKRNGELGLPHVDIRHYVTSDTYTGFTKKGINFPIEYLDEFVLMITDVLDECDKRGIGIE